MTVFDSALKKVRWYSICVGPVIWGGGGGVVGGGLSSRSVNIAVTGTETVQDQ